MTLLKFNSKYVLTDSSHSVNVSSSTLADDTYASQTFSLSKTQTVLVIYQVANNYGTTEDSAGKYIAINVDGVNYGQVGQCPYDSNFPEGETTFWIGSLAAGNHTIKGQFAATVNTKTVTIDNRSLIIIIFDGDEFTLATSAVANTFTSTSFADDNVSITATPSGSCVALAIYAVSNNKGSVEGGYGRKIAINFGGSDLVQVEGTPACAANYTEAEFTAYAASQDATSLTVKGRAAVNSSGTSTIDRHYLALLFFDPSTLLDINTTVSQVSTTSNTLVDDSQCTISRTTTDSRELLVIAIGTKRRPTSSDFHGECYGISINGVDVASSRQSPFNSGEANSVSTSYGLTVAAGSQTIKGRLSNNLTTSTAIIDARVVIALWFSSGSTVEDTASIGSISNLTSTDEPLIELSANLANISKIYGVRELIQQIQSILTNYSSIQSTDRIIAELGLIIESISSASSIDEVTAEPTASISTLARIYSAYSLFELIEIAASCRSASLISAVDRVLAEAAAQILSETNVQAITERLHESRANIEASSLLQSNDEVLEIVHLAIDSISRILSDNENIAETAANLRSNSKLMAAASLILIEVIERIISSSEVNPTLWQIQESQARLSSISSEYSHLDLIADIAALIVGSSRILCSSKQDAEFKAKVFSDSIFFINEFTRLYEASADIKSLGNLISRINEIQEIQGLILSDSELEAMAWAEMIYVKLWMETSLYRNNFDKTQIFRKMYDSSEV